MQFSEQAENAEYIAAADRAAFLKQMAQLGPKSRLACSPDQDQDRLQGDVLAGVPCVMLGPDEHPLCKALFCLALNTTCNLQPGRMEFCNVALISTYERYAASAREEQPDTEKLETRLDALRRNVLDRFLYIPQCNGFDGPIVVHLNSICTIPRSVYEKTLADGRRVGSLTQLGAYVFLVKISRFFARETHEVKREPLPPLPSD